MNIKKLLALLLVAAMCLTLLAACSSDKNTVEDGEPSSSDTEDGEPESPDADEPDDEDDEDEEMAEITMCYFDVMSNGEKGDHVQEAVNAITETEYNLHIDIYWWAIGDYMTQLSLAASSGDLPDIIGGFPMLSAASMMSSGQLMDIAPYLDSEDAKGFMDEVGQYMGAFTINGGVYGIPTSRIYTTQYYIIMRKDILDELGMVDKAQNMKTWAEYEEVLAAVDGAYDDIYPVSKGTGKNVFANVDVQWTSIADKGNFSDYYLTDKLGDVTGWITSNEEGKVIPVYELDSYVDACKIAREWYDKGWLYPDGAYSDDHCDTLMKQGVQFSDFQPSEVGVESSKLNATGYEVVCTQINDAMVKTSDLTTWGMGLSTNCDDPEASLRFISAYYADERIANLMTWGVEGVDYNVNENGEAYYGEIDPATAYHSGDWIHGNQFLVLPWEGQGGDFRAVSKEINNSATNSPYLGFAMDSTDLDGLVAAITAVSDEYLGTLGGGYYTDAILDECAAKMEAAGIYDYCAAFQEQLDEWMQNN